MEALSSRFFVRSYRLGRFDELVKGYALSFGIFLVVVITVLAARFFAGADGRDEPGVRRTGIAQNTLAIFILACVPLIENVLLIRHATDYSYDRLKFVVPAAIILALGFGRLGKDGRMALVVAVLVAAIDGYTSYRADLRAHAAWHEVDQANRALAARVGEAADVRCAVLLSRMEVRGYANLLFHRGIYGAKAMEDGPALMAQRDACAAVYLEGEPALDGLPRYTKAVVTRRDGATTTILAQTAR